PRGVTMRAVPLLTILTLAVAPAAARADSLRCAGGIVSVGDAKLDLLGKCGEPALVDPHTEERGRVRVDAAQQVATSRREVVTVEQWTYDFGPSSFVQLVTVEGGKVIAVERGSYGHARAVPAPVALPVAACGSAAFEIGIGKLELLSRCGAPASKDLRADVQTAAVGAAAGAGADVVTTTADQEIWTYNLGPDAFLQLATFKAGKLVKVERGGYGYPR
ncbi:MAG: DUF2845 domain-containing protein, partial [Gemmatimonadaceae bacterium]